jgi:hypothetical protein
MADVQWDGAASGDATSPPDPLSHEERGNQTRDLVTGDRLARELEQWQAEQERRFNRAWRRPGGLARPAGL